MKNLLISGNTLQEWNLNEIFEKTPVFSNQNDIERLIQYDSDNKIGPYCNGMTYLEIEQLDNQFNNF